MTEKFDQNKYIASWKKENMKSVNAFYNKEFVLEFREACAKMNIKQSDVIRKAMQQVIDESKSK